MECDNWRVFIWWSDLLDSLIQRVTTFYSSLLHTADVPLPVGSRTAPAYQLLPATAHNNRTPAVLWLTDCNKSKSKLCYDWRSVGQSVLCQAPIWGPRPDFYYCQTVAILLMLGAISDKRMGLSFRFATGLRQCSHSRVEVPGTHENIYCLRFETPPTCRARSPYLYPPGTGWPSYTPRHWVPFSSSPTTRRAAVEVFEPVSTRGKAGCCDSKVLAFSEYATMYYWNYKNFSCHKC
jgi:hypothetical protein